MNNRDVRGRPLRRRRCVHSARMGCQARFDEPGHRYSNPLIAWLMARPGSMVRYLESLAIFDASLHDALKDAYGAKRADLRLGLALFLDYAGSLGLSGAELAGLMADPREEIAEALAYLIGAARFEQRVLAFGDASC